jgi:predicted RND superfamily exporter protein
MEDTKLEIHGLIHRLPDQVRRWALLLIWTLAFGYTAGMFYLVDTTSMAPQGIEENYLGNEDQEDAEKMKFKMTKKQVLNIIHSHVISYSLIFFLLGTVLLLSSVKKPWKTILLIEPLLSLVLTFGGLYLLWTGITWMKYVVMLAGICLSIGFYLTLFLLTLDLVKRQR